MRRRIEECLYSEVMARVAYQLVALDHRRNKPLYGAFPAGRIYNLAEQMRAAGFAGMYWTLNGCSRWVAAGYPLASWRDQSPLEFGQRAFHKRKAPRRP